jgi:hypothetical protein
VRERDPKKSKSIKKHVLNASSELLLIPNLRFNSRQVTVAHKRVRHCMIQYYTRTTYGRIRSIVEDQNAFYIYYVCTPMRKKSGAKALGLENVMVFVFPALKPESDTL